MMESQLSYSPDGWVNGWPDTLEKLTALDFDTVLPGHGAPFKGKDKIRAFQSYLRDFYKQRMTLQQQGLWVEDAEKRVDLLRNAPNRRQFAAPGPVLGRR